MWELSCFIVAIPLRVLRAVHVAGDPSRNVANENVKALKGE